MRVEVNNFMGCEKAEVEFKKAALICGMNHQGKSSFLTALSAALTGEAIPLGLKKTDCGMLVKVGSTGASVKVQNDAFETVSINWPKAEISTDGKNPPATTKMAAGLESLVNMKEKERSEFIRELVKCNPTKKDLEEFLGERGCTNEKLINAVWTFIEQDGFEASHKRACDTGRSLKNQWSDVTGEAYGSQKAETWQPIGWNSSLIDLSKETLETQLTAARAELEDMIARQAVDTSKKEEYEQLANERSLMIARQNAKICYDNVKSYEKDVADAEVLIRQLTAKVEEQHCPHCGGLLQIVAGKVTELQEQPDNSARIEILKQKIAEGKEKIKENDSQYLTYTKQVSQIENAFAKLDEINKSSSGNVTPIDIDKKRNQIKQIEDNIKAFEAKTESDRLKNKIKENQLVIDALDMSGIRKKSTEKGLEFFNSNLEDVCSIAGWPKVSISRDMSIELDGRPYVLLSESEKYRVRITLQIAIAKLQKAAVIILDGAEILDKNGKNGLFKTLLQYQITAFIGMMFSDISKVPNMSKFGIKSYWVEKGNFKEIN